MLSFLIKLIENNDKWIIQNCWNKNYTHYFQLPFEECLEFVEVSLILEVIEHCKSKINPDSNKFYSILLFEAARYGYIEITPAILKHQNQIHARHLNPEITAVYELYFPDDYNHIGNGPKYFEDDTFDLILCNPPFHFEHENNIDIAINLFRGAQRTLRSSGRFLCVANNHLNYRTHLDQVFGRVTTIAENERFTVFECRKLGGL